MKEVREGMHTSAGLPVPPTHASMGYHCGSNDTAEAIHTKTLRAQEE